MERMDTDFIVYPTISEYFFFKGDMNGLNPHKIFDFNLISEDDPLNFQITFSGLNLVKNSYVESNSIYLVFLFYDKLSNNNVNINNVWAIEFNEKQMNSSNESLRFSLNKATLNLKSKNYDFVNDYPELKVFAFPKRFPIVELDENKLFELIFYTQSNELLKVRVPLVSVKEGKDAQQ